MRIGLGSRSGVRTLSATRVSGSVMPVVSRPSRAAICAAPSESAALAQHNRGVGAIGDQVGVGVAEPAVDRKRVGQIEGPSRRGRSASRSSSAFGGTAAIAG